MTPPQPPEPLTQERIKELAKIIDAYECPHDYFLCADCREEIADALDKLAKVVERCEQGEQKVPFDGYPLVAKAVAAERRAILSLLSSGPASAPTEGER